MSKKTTITGTKSVCPHCLRVLDGELVRDGQSIYLQKHCPEHGEFSTLVWAEGLDFEAWGGLGASSETWGGRCASNEGTGTFQQLEPCPSGCLACSEHKTRSCCVLFEVTARCNLNCPVCFADAGSLDAGAGSTDADAGSTDAGASAGGEAAAAIDTVGVRAEGTANDTVGACGDGAGDSATGKSEVSYNDGARQFSSADPALEDIASWFDSLKRQAGICNIQLSGGEPTLRDDLSQIIRIGKQKGFEYFQLNTNGLRLSSQPNLAATLKEAGLSCVFLQFDGFSAAGSKALRGRQLINEKIAAIQNCAAAQLPVVLVPTLAKGINDEELMTIIEFGIKHAPGVRGVHIQPLSGFGRCTIDASSVRMTIPEVLVALEQQSGGMISRQHFSGGTAENSYCSFSANYLIGEEGKLEYLGGASTANDATCCSDSLARCCVDKVAIAQDIQKRRWAPDLCTSEPSINANYKPGSLDDWLAHGKLMSFSITGMAFMDAYNLDFERLKSCYIFVMSRSGKPVPFCAYNLTDTAGKSIYR